MAAVFFQAKDWVTSKVTPDCMKAKAAEVKKFAKEKAGAGGDFHGEGGDPHDPNNKNKITEWQAAWNVTNAIQVFWLLYACCKAAKNVVTLLGDSFAFSFGV